MIYRIAIGTIIDGKWKFDHYATDEEYRNLRITPDGKVVSLKIQEHFRNPITGKPTYRIAETDVSETHKVEVGFTFEGNQYFQNDILKIWITKCDDEPEINEFYYAKIYHDPEYDCLMIHDTNLEFDYTFANYSIDWYNTSESFDSWEIAGNSNENPELEEN